MNELFAADPCVCESARDLRLLLKSFGPYTGRYLANYSKNDWIAQVKKQCEHLGEVEISNIKDQLQRAKDNLKLIGSERLTWRPERDWQENAEDLLESRILNGLISKQNKPPLIHTLDSLELRATADERIEGEANEYARVTERLLRLSPKIAFIDPFLDPTQDGCKEVMQALLNIVAKGKCEEIILWARASAVTGLKYPIQNPTIIEDERNKRTLNKLENELKYLTKNANFKRKCTIEMLLVDDKGSDKMHARYLLSKHGGIRLDQGFREVSGQPVDVSPIGEAIHLDLCNYYFGNNSMKIRHRFKQPC
ncbi:MAG: hypothetical protein ABIO88_16340 [Burkholderiaceae bacterium]